MGYVGELSDRLNGLRELLSEAGKTAAAATASTSRVRNRLHRQLRRIRGQLEVIGVAASRVLVEVDVLDAQRRPVKVHRPPADIEIDAGG